VLFMQLNRLKYEQGNAVKSLTEMRLESVIYPDRFLIKNKEQSEKLRSSVHVLRDKVRYLEKCLNEYKHFDGTDYNIQKCLELVGSFF
jgi:hypothetical protein